MQNDINLLIEEVKKLYYEGNFEAAFLIANQIIEKEPAKGFFVRGNVYDDLGNYEQALSDYNQAIALDPKYAAAYNNRGIIYDDLGNYEQALSDYNQAIALDPKDALAYNNRGIIYKDLGNYEQALSDYNQAIALDPKYALAYNGRGIIYKDLGNYEMALSDYNQAIDLDPKDAGAYNNRGTVYDDLGNYEQALSDYNQAIALDPKDAMAYNNRGIIYKDLGNYEQALSDYNQAIALDPKDALAYNGRGNVYKYLGNYDRALSDYTQAIALDSKYAAAYWNKGLFYHDPSGGLGNKFIKARRHYLKSFALAEKQRKYQFITECYRQLFLLEYGKFGDMERDWSYLQHFWICQNYETERQGQRSQPYRVTLEEKHLRQIIDFLMEADKPLFTLNFFKKYFDYQDLKDLKDFTFIGYKAGLSKLFAQAERFLSLFNYWRDNNEKRQSPYDYYLHQALVYYYGGDNVKAYQILDDMEGEVEASEDFIWQYYLLRVGKSGGCYLRNFQKTGEDNTDYTRQDAKEELQNLDQDFQNLIQAQKPSLNTFKGIHDQYHIALYHLEKGKYQEALIYLESIPDKKYAHGLFDFSQYLILLCAEKLGDDAKKEARFQKILTRESLGEGLLNLSKDFSFYTKKMEDINVHFWTYIHLLDIQGILDLIKTSPLPNSKPEAEISLEQFKKIRDKLASFAKTTFLEFWDFSDDVQKTLEDLKIKFREEEIEKMHDKLEKSFGELKFEEILKSDKTEVITGDKIMDERKIEEKKLSKSKELEKFESNFDLLISYLYIKEKITFEQRMNLASWLAHQISKQKNENGNWAVKYALPTVVGRSVGWFFSWQSGGVASFTSPFIVEGLKTFFTNLTTDKLKTCYLKASQSKENFNSYTEFKRYIDELKKTDSK